MLMPEETPMSTTGSASSIDQHFGYKCHDDADGVLSTLTDDIEHDVVGFPGRPAARQRRRAGVFTAACLLTSSRNACSRSAAATARILSPTSAAIGNIRLSALAHTTGPSACEQSSWPDLIRPALNRRFGAAG